MYAAKTELLIFSPQTPLPLLFSIIEANTNIFLLTQPKGNL